MVPDDPPAPAAGPNGVVLTENVLGRMNEPSVDVAETVQTAPHLLVECVYEALKKSVFDAGVEDAAVSAAAVPHTK